MLATLSRASVPAHLECELLVVDNAPALATAAAVEASDLSAFDVRYLPEPQRGKGYAYNRGIAEARGEILLFSDDDVRVPAKWVTEMTAPILSGSEAVVAGGVRIAPHLVRPWMTPEHKAWLASTEGSTEEHPEFLIGANMAFSRSVLANVPAFDIELGPGALGFYDETLFSWQLKEAGYRIAAAYDTAVEHHFDPTRLLRKQMRTAAEKMGRSAAYVAYHWQQGPEPPFYLRLFKAKVRLLQKRLFGKKEESGAEGLPFPDMLRLSDIAFCRQYLKEKKRPRNYERHGLVKRR